MAPTTEFEDTSGGSWTSLAGEQSFLETIAAETSATLSTPGVSVEGRPLWRIDVGSRAEHTLMVSAMVHADEQAAREAALQFVRDLAYSEDPGVLDYLDAHRVVVMPTSNPDGFALGQRQNANGVDINRDGFSLSTPEAQAIMDTMVATRPEIFIDCHERPNLAPEIEFMYDRPRTVCLHPGWGQKGDEILAILRGELDTMGVSHTLYPNPGRRSWREYAALNHSLGVLLETTTADDAVTRVGWYLAMIEQVRAWHAAESGNLAALAAESRSYQSQTTNRYVLQNGNTAAGGAWPQTVLPDRLAGYDLGAPLPQRLIDAYGIVVTDGGRVALSQPARAVIPILLDQESGDQVVPAERIIGEDDDDDTPIDPGEILPPGTFSPIVTWLGCDLLTGRIIAELPEITGNIGRLLGAYTSANLSTPIPSGVLARLAVQATVPMRTMIVAVVNNQPCWAGIVLTRQRGTGATMDLATATPEVYLNRRTVRDHNWRGRDEASVIAAGLVRDAGDIPGVGPGIGLEIDAPPTGRSRDREYAAMDRATVYDRLRELMGVRGGPEFTIEPMWGDDDQTRVRLVVRIRSRIGIASTQPRAVFESQGASSASYTLTEDYSDGKGANYVMASSSGEGEDKPTSDPAIATDMLNAGWPIVEHHFEPGSNISRIGTLNEHAQRELELLARGANVWTIDARWNVYPSLNIDWRIGDDIAWNLTGHGHPEGTTGTGRCIGWELRPGEGTVSPILLNPQEGTT